MAARTPQVSQKRIAEAAGVSQPTVSLVLSGRDVGSEVTRQRVLEAAELLKYRPNLLVRGMQTGKTRVIGVMAPPFDSFWSDVLYGIHDTLSAADHVPMTLWTSHEGRHRRKAPPPSAGHELQQIHRLLDRRIDGVILWPPFASLYVNHIHEFSSRDLPIVTIDHELPAEFHADCVSSDEETGAQAIAKHLYDLGHRRIGHLAGASTASWAVNRRKAFESAIKAYPDVKLTVLEAPSGEDPTKAIGQAREMLAGNRPTAVFAATDLLARQMYIAAMEKGLRIPDDFSVVGFADDDFAADLQPPLTTVRQAGYEIGCRAAKLVLGRSSGEMTSRSPIRVRTAVEFIVRASTGPVKGSRN